MKSEESQFPEKKAAEENDPTLHESHLRLARRNHGGLLFAADRRHQDPAPARSVRELQGYNPLRHHDYSLRGHACPVEGFDRPISP